MVATPASASLLEFATNAPKEKVIDTTIAEPWFSYSKVKYANATGHATASPNSGISGR